MNEGFKFKTLAPAQQAARDAYQEKLLARDDARMLNAPANPTHVNLRTFRLARGLTKRETAEMMEVTERAYYSYEQGLRNVPSDALVKLAVLTDGDLNEIMLGRRAAPEPELVDAFMNDVRCVQEILCKTYPKMDSLTQLKVARFAVTHDWRPFYSSIEDPDLIRNAVVIETGYRYHPEEAPAPPHPEHYADDKTYLDACESWLADFGKGSVLKESSENTAIEQPLVELKM